MCEASSCSEAGARKACLAWLNQSFATKHCSKTDRAAN